MPYDLSPTLAPSPSTNVLLFFNHSGTPCICDNVYEPQYRQFLGISFHWCKISGVYFQSLSSRLSWCLGRMLPRYRRNVVARLSNGWRMYKKGLHDTLFCVQNMYKIFCLGKHTNKLMEAFGGYVYLKISLCWGQLSHKISLG